MLRSAILQGIKFFMTSRQLDKIYEPQAVEARWGQYWIDQGYFAAKSDAPGDSYTIVIPPPNVTGVLHMGHMLNNTNRI